FKEPLARTGPDMAFGILSQAEHTLRLQTSSGIVDCDPPAAGIEFDQSSGAQSGPQFPIACREQAQDTAAERSRGPCEPTLRFLVEAAQSGFRTGPQGSRRVAPDRPDQVVAKTFR